MLLSPLLFGPGRVYRPISSACFVLPLLTVVRALHILMRHPHRFLCALPFYHFCMDVKMLWLQLFASQWFANQTLIFMQSVPPGIFSVVSKFARSFASDSQLPSSTLGSFPEGVCFVSTFSPPGFFGGIMSPGPIANHFPARWRLSIFKNPWTNHIRAWGRASDYLF